LKKRQTPRKRLPRTPAKQLNTALKQLAVPFPVGPKQPNGPSVRL
jgi:hypothetical protein